MAKQLSAETVQRKGNIELRGCVLLVNNGQRHSRLLVQQSKRIWRDKRYYMALRVRSRDCRFVINFPLFRLLCQAFSFADVDTYDMLLHFYYPKSSPGCTFWWWPSPIPWDLNTLVEVFTIITTRCKYFDPCYARATVVRARFLAAAFSDGSYLAHVNSAYLRHVTFCIVSSSCRLSVNMGRGPLLT